MMKPELYADLETFSTVPIGHGTHAYAAEAEVMLFPYAFGDGEVKCWDATTGEPMPADLKEALEDPEVQTVWFNGGMFDLTVLHATGVSQLPHSRVFDVMVCAMAHALPGSLDELCDVMQIDADKAKIKTGKKLIHLFCKPQEFKFAFKRADFPSLKAYQAAKAEAEAVWAGRATRLTHPKEWAEFIEYAKADITSMRALKKKLPTWNYKGREYDLWLLDQKINNRGVYVDLELVNAALAASDIAKEKLALRTQEITNGEVQAATQRDVLLEHVFAEYGISLPNMQMATLERRMEDPDLPPALKELLSVRLQSSTTSVTKFKKFKQATSADSRVRGLLQFDGAGRTLRWAGRTVQPQNFVRPTMKNKDIDFAIDVIKAGACDLFYEDAMLVLSNVMRGCLAAPPGRKLVVADLANIEGRVAAWLAGENWKLPKFTAYDTFVVDGEGEKIPDGKGDFLREGPDLYKVAYAKAFNIDHETVLGPQRQIGKVMELMCFAADTQVLTDNGVKSIVAVLPTDKLWDGVEWVKHKGLVARGVKKVVNVAGIEVTPDHLVLTGQTWTQAQQLVSNENLLSLALVTGSENLPSWALTSVWQEGCSPSSCVAPAGRPRIQCFFITFLKGLVQGAKRALVKCRDTGAKNTTVTPILSQMRSTECAYSGVSLPALTDVVSPQIADTKTMEGEASVYTPHGWPIGENILSISLRWMGGMYPILNWIASTLTVTTRQAICASSPSKSTALTNAAYKSCNDVYLNSKPVYDLALAGPRSRFTILSAKGPLIVHNCGYEGGVGAYITGAATYGIDLSDMAEKAFPTLPSNVLSDAENFLKWTIKQKRTTFDLSDDVFIACDSLKRLWRLAHPAISSYWGELKEAFTLATLHPGAIIECRKLKFRRDGAWLRIQLPSGRALCYPSPQVAEDGTLSYMGKHQYTRKWCRLKTYGGKLFENVCQALARDVMAHAMQPAEDAGYEVVLTVHDELLCETPDTNSFNVEGLSAILSTVPEWAPGLPLAAAGFSAYRYRKG